MFRIVGRAVRLAGVLGGRLGVLAFLALGGRFSPERWLADTVTACGPAFVKAAQLLSTRADVLPARVCRALARLHDGVRAVPAPRAVVRLRAELGAEDAVLVGAGSIACVYRVRLPDGRVVAAKVRRPGIERALCGDLALIERCARIAAKVPMLRGVPMVEIANQLTTSIRRQLDFGAEAEVLRELRQSLGDLDGVTVPEPDPTLSTEDILVMEFVGGLARVSPADLAEGDRRRAVVTALRAVYRMLFVDGVAHCDLHPGNLYFRRDGSIVVLDAGFAVRLDDSARERFAVFFYCLSQGDGPACAEIMLSTTANPGGDTTAFRAELTGLVAASTGRLAADFDLFSFATKLFDIQRRHGHHADPRFVFPILSLLVLEGTVRAFHPEVDFQREARPFLVTALMERALAGAAR